MTEPHQPITKEAAAQILLVSKRTIDNWLADVAAMAYSRHHPRAFGTNRSNQTSGRRQFHRLTAPAQEGCCAHPL